MNFESARRIFGTNDGHLPRVALDWCADNWNAAGPAALAAFEAFTRDEEEGEEETSLALFGLYLAAQKRDTSWCAPLARAARTEGVLDELLDDGVTEDLSKLILATFDGSLATLRGVIDDPDADEFIRGGYMDAHAALALNGRIDADEAQAWHFDLFDRMKPRLGKFIWVAWAEIAILFDPDRALPLISKAYAENLIDETYDRFRGFEERARDNKRSPALAIADFLESNKPFDSAAEHLSHWYCFTQEYRDRLAKGETDAPPHHNAYDDVDMPVTNPWRNVGRNDPCPCGSGKKFKKCCIGTAP